MTWIHTIAYPQAKGTLKQLYDRVKGLDDYIDNILLVHSLRPHTLKGHMYLYKNVLHHRSNTLSKWLLEALGVYVSMLNACAYCVDHHFAGMKRLLDDGDRATSIRQALERQEPEACFSGKHLAFFRYAQELTLRPGMMSGASLEEMRRHGADDGEILEVNQVVSYFAYANRTVLGLGVTTAGDVLGMSPGDTADADNWVHE
jgi:uncharacterized peroxidase-related enzyme